MSTLDLSACTPPCVRTQSLPASSKRHSSPPPSNPPAHLPARVRSSRRSPTSSPSRSRSPSPARSPVRSRPRSNGVAERWQGDLEQSAGLEQLTVRVPRTVSSPTAASAAVPPMQASTPDTAGPAVVKDDQGGEDGVDGSISRWGEGDGEDGMQELDYDDELMEDCPEEPRDDLPQHPSPSRYGSLRMAEGRGLLHHIRALGITCILLFLHIHTRALARLQGRAVMSCMPSHLHALLPIGLEVQFCCHQAVQHPIISFSFFRGLWSRAAPINRQNLLSFSHRVMSLVSKRGTLCGYKYCDHIVASAWKFSRVCRCLSHHASTALATPVHSECLHASTQFTALHCTPVVCPSWARHRRWLDWSCSSQQARMGTQLRHNASATAESSLVATKPRGGRHALQGFN